ncbi:MULTISPECIES: LPXTG cell wall anchor domain-containing protein [Enterococcus]|uniref:LPXTG cell wall anchor domain-containing protein n=1 Tax=Enterococcus alishanensis TaxID=1303817 RepID=A0ABS6TDX3_9ENTE|nr:LPXTG cell wall anchor domain-containing protein [Enterococcus alishanensis]MBV7391101.1 LPXTG cell wall anchor domain-containing protein [Enterococcus alishanensis]
MKKIFYLLFSLCLLLSGNVSVFAEVYTSIEQPTENVKNQDVWNRDVGDGVDTFEFKDGHWTPLTSTSERRVTAKKKYNTEIFEPNKAQQIEYIKNAQENEDFYKDLAEDQVDYIAVPDNDVNKSVKVRVPKIEVDSVKANSAFYIDNSVPEMLDVLAVNKDTEDKSSKSSSDSSSNSEESTSSTSEAPLIELSSKDQTFNVELGKVLSNEQLLNSVTFNGNKADLKIKITKSYFVYVTPDAEVYHYDLNALLGKTTVDRISVMTENQAVLNGLRASTENSDKNIGAINISLPGKYRVEFSYQDKVFASSDVTILGDKIASTETGNTVPSATSSLSKPSYTSKTLPQTGSESSSYFILGIPITIGSIALFYFINKKKTA